MAEKPKSTKTSKDRRRAPRIATSNFLGFVSLDERGGEIGEGYGWTVNLSQSGVRIETFRPIESRSVLLLAVDVQDELLKIKGEIVYAEERERQRYVYGIRFVEAEGDQRRVVSSFVKSYHQRDKKLAESIDYERLFKERE